MTAAGSRIRSFVERPGLDRRRLLCHLATAAAVPLLGGCVTAQLLGSEPGTDVSGIKAGARRSDVEAIVGVPVREWQSIQGVRFCLYEFYGGTVPDLATAAAFVLFMGWFDLYATLEGKDARRYRDKDTVRRGTMIVSYDDRSMALGVFPESEPLPPDGRRRND